jgi:linoleate 10R-lipoxygenase
VLQGYIKANLEKLQTGIWSLGGLRDSLIHLVTGQRDNSDWFLQSLLAAAPASMDVDQLTYNVFGLTVASVANWAMAATHVVNFYLDDARAAEKEDIEHLAMDHSPHAAQRLAGYAREALRFDPQAPGIFRDAAQDTVVEEGHGHRPVSIKKGERIFVSLAHANMDVSGRSGAHGW